MSIFQFNHFKPHRTATQGESMTLEQSRRYNSDDGSMMMMTIVMMMVMMMVIMTIGMMIGMIMMMRLTTV